MYEMSDLTDALTLRNGLERTVGEHFNILFDFVKKKKRKKGTREGRKEGRRKEKKEWKGVLDSSDKKSHR